VVQESLLLIELEQAAAVKAQLVAMRLIHTVALAEQEQIHIHLGQLRLELVYLAITLVVAVVLLMNTMTA